jgi:hypothetical protein
MLFPVLKQLQKNNPRLTKTIEALDEYLSGLEGNAKNHITATGAAQATGGPRKEVLGILMAAANLGLLNLKYRVECPNSAAGLRDYDNLEDIPRSLPCDLCGEDHVITSDDVEYFFQLQDQLVGAEK